MTAPIAARQYLSNIHGVEAALLSEAQIAEYERDGAIVIRGAFGNWVDSLAAGIGRNMAEPGEYAAENLQAHETGRFFDGYCNWRRIRS